MSPEANKITPCDVTTDQLTYWYGHFSIRYEFYATVQTQTIIKTESESFSYEQMLYGHTRLFY